MAVVSNTHESFVTTTRGLRREIPPMVLWERAKKLGIWNPADFDFSQDTKDWAKLTDKQREYTLMLASQFISGEEAVTLDLLPLIKIVSEQGHLEEEMFLTTFLWEEAKHVDFFSRALDAYGVKSQDLAQYHPPTYSKLFYETFPQRMKALYDDPSPAAMVRASTTYNLGIEGILAETGYFMWYKLMDSEGILPGTRQGLRKIQMDESRHIAYGVFLISRLIVEDPSLYEIVEEIMDEMLQYLVDSNQQTQERIGDIPFDFNYDEVLEFGMSQHARRMAKIGKARGKTLEELYKTAAVEEMLEDSTTS